MKLRLDTVAIISLACLTAMAFAPALTGTWIGDDDGLLVSNPCVHDLALWLEHVISRQGTCSYRPVRYLSHALEYALWGPQPMGFHFTNLLLHVIATLTCFALLRRLDIPLMWAWTGALVFGIHPVQADAVAYISGRRDVLMGTFFLLSVYCADLGLRDFQTSKRKKVLFLSLAACCGVLSMATKEMGVTVAAVIPLWLALSVLPPEALVRARANWRRFLPALSSVLVLALGALLVVINRGLVSPVSTVADQLFGGSLPTHIATVLSAHLRYVEMLFFPMRLPGDYAPPVIEVPDSLLALAPLLGFLWLLTLLALGFLAVHRGWRTEALGIFWYLVTMLPVSHIIPHHELAAEHYLYIPIVGLVVFAAKRLSVVSTDLEISHGQRRAAMLIAGLVLTTLFARSFLRSQDFQSELTFAAATVRWAPESVRGNARLGVALLNAGRHEEAYPHFQLVLGTRYQGSARLDTLRALGRHFADHGRFPEALRALEEYRVHRPYDERALRSLAYAHFRLRQYREAHELHDTLARRNPESLDDAYRLALTHALLGEHAESIAVLEQVLDRNPNHGDALDLLMHVQGRRKSPPEELPSNPTEVSDLP